MIDIKQYVCGSHRATSSGPGSSPASRRKLDEDRPRAQSGHAVPFRSKQTVVTSPDMILNVMRDANKRRAMCWSDHVDAHIFSGEMWIRGLNALQKPLLHLHTQYNRTFPGTHRHGFYDLTRRLTVTRIRFICARNEEEPEVVVGHWQDRACTCRSANG